MQYIINKIENLKKKSRTLPSTLKHNAYLSNCHFQGIKTLLGFSSELTAKTHVDKIW